MVNCKIFSASPVGLKIYLIEVEISIDSMGFPAFNIVGLADKSVEEAKERVRSGIKSLGYKFPDKRITVNLAPAEIPKKGTLFDFPIALGILLASGQAKFSLDKTIVAGEMSLDGRLRRISGALPISIFAKENGFSNLLIPCESEKEAALISQTSVFAFGNLKEAVKHLEGENKILRSPALDMTEMLKTVPADSDLPDFSDICGQTKAKRALEIAAAGFHNIALVGTPGSGKTLLSRAFGSILPDLTPQECIQVTKIYSVSGLLKSENSYLVTKRPFRSPHHTISLTGMIGGGFIPQPGEVTLAHRGVLFIDEFAELPRTILEALRQPIEDGYVSISRGRHKVTFPSRFILVASYNRCPCGYFGDPENKCICTPYQIISYNKKISGPITDRIDLFIETETAGNTLIKSESGERSIEVKARVERARNFQLQRYRDDPQIFSNGEVAFGQIGKYMKPNEEASNLLRDYVFRYKLSMRSYHRILKVSRTIADLEESEVIKVEHTAEAVQYKNPNIK